MKKKLEIRLEIISEVIADHMKYAAADALQDAISRLWAKNDMIDKVLYSEEASNIRFFSMGERFEKLYRKRTRLIDKTIYIGDIINMLIDMKNEYRKNK